MLDSSLGLMIAAVDRHDTIGVLLLVMAVFFAVLAYFLSKAGFKADQAAAVTQAVQKTQSVASDAQQTIATAQTRMAQETGIAPADVASSTQSVAAVLPSLYEEASNVSKQIDKLTGNQIPAGVPWSLCVLCLLGAFASFGLVAADIGPNASSPPAATTTTSTTP